MGVGAGLYMCDVVKQFTFAISSLMSSCLILNDTKLQIFSLSRHLELTSQQTAASPQTAAEFWQRLHGIGCH